MYIAKKNLCAKQNHLGQERNIASYKQRCNLHAVMLSSKTAVLVCAFRFSCPPVPLTFRRWGYMPLVPMVHAARD